MRQHFFLHSTFYILNYIRGIINMKARLPEQYRGGGGGGGGNVNDMVRQAQKMQENMAKVQEELETREYQITAGGGAIEVTIGGNKEIKALKIKPEVVDPEDVEMLEDLIVAAVNEAIRKVEETSSGEMQKVTGSVNIPGMF
jgi:DNA-binding YbaB/EbfC family protein